MNGEKVYLSKEKVQELQKELEHLRTEGRKEVATRLEYTKSLGDISENAEYQDARDEQAAVEDRILTIESLLKSAVVVSAHKIDAVDMGSIVTVKLDGGEGSQTYTLVSSEETNVKEGKISNKSPLGEAIFGKKKDDAFAYKTPRGEVRGIITKIE